MENSQEQRPNFGKYCTVSICQLVTHSVENKSIWQWPISIFRSIDCHNAIHHRLFFIPTGLIPIAFSACYKLLCDCVQRMNVKILWLIKTFAPWSAKLTARGYTQTIGLGVPKPLPYLWPNSLVFPTLFMTWPKICSTIYDCCGCHSYIKQNLLRALIDDLIDKNKK